MNLLTTLFLLAFLPGLTVVSKFQIVGAPEKSTSEFVSSSVRDVNGRICAAIKVISDLDGFRYDSYNRVVRVIDQPGQDMVFLQPDERVLEIFHSGYEPLKLIFTDIGIRLSSGQVWEIKITKHEQGTELLVSVLTEPFGAEVFIDGKSRGKGASFRLPTGQHELRLVKDGYQPVIKQINVEQGNTLFQFTLNRTETPAKVVQNKSIPVNQVFPQVKQSDIGRENQKEYTNTSKNSSEKINYAEAPAKKDDRQGPEILITEPANTRGMKSKTEQKAIRIAGTATDPSGIYEVMINDEEARLEASGQFTHEARLAMGENRITIRATDTKGNSSEKVFTLTRSSPALPALGTNSSSAQSLATGKFIALLIAIQDYNNPAIKSLDQPLADASRLKLVLEKRYGFSPGNIKLLTNPNRTEIIQAFDDLMRQVGAEDNVLVFFAGHSYWDEQLNQGYWLPVNASMQSHAEWLSNSMIKDYIYGIKSKHTLLISDACFSGGIFKSRTLNASSSKAINELYALKSRKAITSGTMTEVPDRSVFMQYLLKRLQDNSAPYLSAEKLFASLKEAVINNSSTNQVPQFGEIRETGDEGGDFIFITTTENR